MSVKQPARTQVALLLFTLSTGACVGSAMDGGGNGNGNGKCKVSL